MKHVVFEGCDGLLVLLSPAFCGGLIEARSPGWPGARRDKLSPAFCGGLIEASR